MSLKYALYAAIATAFNAKEVTVFCPHCKKEEIALRCERLGDKKPFYICYSTLNIFDEAQNDKV